jgi:hypothetical protein
MGTASQMPSNALLPMLSLFLPFWEEQGLFNAGSLQLSEL